MLATADVVELHGDRIPTRRYDVDELRARLEAERDLSAQKRGRADRGFVLLESLRIGIGGRKRVGR